MAGTPAWWRSKCRSAGVTIPTRSCSGASELPWPLPTAMRRGRSKGERWPSSLRGAPGTLVGSGGTVGACPGTWAIPARSRASAPSVPATLASKTRREIGVSVIVSLPVQGCAPKLSRAGLLRGLRTHPNLGHASPSTRHPRVDGGFRGGRYAARPPVRGVPPGDRRHVSRDRPLPHVHRRQCSVHQRTICRGTQRPTHRVEGYLLQNGAARQRLLSDRRRLGPGAVENRAYRPGGRVGETRANLPVLERRAAVRVARLVSRGDRAMDQQSRLRRRPDRLWATHRPPLSGMPQHVVSDPHGRGRGAVRPRLRARHHLRKMSWGRASPRPVSDIPSDGHERTLHSQSRALLQRPEGGQLCPVPRRRAGPESPAVLLPTW